MICAEHRPALEVALAAAIEEGTPYDMEVELNAGDGQKKWVRIICRPIMERGRVIRVRGSFQDITDGKQAENRLRESEQRLRLALEAAGAIAFTWEIPSDSVTRYFSKEPVLPVTAERFGTLDGVRACIHPDDLPGFDARLSACLASGTQYHNTYRVVRPDETIASLEDFGFLDRSADGSPLRLTGMVIDITERKRLQEQFLQAQKMEAVGRLAGGVAHDFNNILTVINASCELLLMSDLPVGDPRREPVTLILDAGQRAARLTQQLLSLSRKGIVEPKVIDLNEIVIRSAQLLQRLIGEDILLAVVTAPIPFRVRADRSQLEQVIMNLAVNARDAMPTGGRLTIETSVITSPNGEPSRFAGLSITDSGQGMTNEVKEKAFEPFFTTKGVGKGSGLGLAVVHGVVAQCGGQIEIETSVGVGTTFRILLPLVDVEPDAVPPSVTVASTSRGTETIVLVEDEEAVRRVVCDSLQLQGYTVLQANGGAAAVHLAQTHPGTIDLLVSDVVMPEMGGRRVIEEVRLHRPGLRVLFMSGYTDDAVLLHGVVESKDAFIQKPFLPQELAKKVREVIDAPLR